jgi:S-adenosylmethionine decarboxylase
VRNRVSIHAHLIIEYYGCKVAFSSQEIIEKMFNEATKISNIRAVKSVSHHFKPIGLTHVKILEESHLSVHTYEEDKHRLSVDAYICGKTYAKARKKAHNLHRFLVRKLKPEDFKLIEIKRGYDPKSKGLVLEIMRNK